MKKIIFVLITLNMAACALPKKHILSAGLVSMTERGRSSSTLKDIGRVESSYCQGDEPISAKDGQIGLIDEVIQRAQRDAQVSYVKNAQFYAQGNCVTMEGVGLREDMALKKDSLRK